MVRTDTVEIFYSIASLLFAALAVLLVVYRKRKKLKLKIIVGQCSLIIVSFCWGWFVPIKIGQIGESSICKFRFQVFVYDIHDYNGTGDLSDWLFLYNYDKGAKYGGMQFYQRIGGIQQYFGLKEVK